MARKPVAEWRSWHDAPHVLTTRQVLDLFNLDRRTLNGLVAAGLLKRSELLRHYRYPKPEVQRFAHQQHLDPFPDSNPFHVKSLGAS